MALAELPIYGSKGYPQCLSSGLYCPINEEPKGPTGKQAV